MKRNILLLFLIFFLFGGNIKLFAQDNCSIAIEPFEFTASSTKEVTQNIKEIEVYSKSNSAEFNQRVKGNLILMADDNISIACIETKFNGNVDIGGNDYSTISNFIGCDFKKKETYYFIPQHDAPAWTECKTDKIWVDLHVTKGKKGNDFVFKFFIPEKSAEGKPYEAEYPISSIILNDQPFPLPEGKKNYGVIKTGSIYTDTIRNANNIIRVEIKVKGLGKSFKLMYIDKNKGEDLSKEPIQGFQFYNLPAKTIFDDSTFFSFQRVGTINVKPDENYQVCIVLTLSNGKECPLIKKNKFIIQPIVEEFKTGKIDTLEKRTITGRRGSLIYRYIFDVPSGTSSLQFNYKAIIQCKNGTDDDKGHVNACSVFIYKLEEKE